MIQDGVEAVRWAWVLINLGTSGRTRAGCNIAIRMRKKETFPTIPDELTVDTSRVTEMIMQSPAKRKCTSEWKKRKGNGKGNGKGGGGKQKSQWQLCGASTYNTWNQWAKEPPPLPFWPPGAISGPHPRFAGPAVTRGDSTAQGAIPGRTLGTHHTEVAGTPAKTHSTCISTRRHHYTSAGFNFPTRPHRLPPGADTVLQMRSPSSWWMMTMELIRRARLMGRRGFRCRTRTCTAVAPKPSVFR